MHFTYCGFCCSLLNSYCVWPFGVRINQLLLKMSVSGIVPKFYVYSLPGHRRSVPWVKWCHWWCILQILTIDATLFISLICLLSFGHHTYVTTGDSLDANYAIMSMVYVVLLILSSDTSWHSHSITPTKYHCLPVINLLQLSLSIPALAHSFYISKPYSTLGQFWLRVSSFSCVMSVEGILSDKC